MLQVWSHCKHAFLDMSVITFSDHHIHCMFETVNDKSKGYITFIYAHNTTEKKKAIMEGFGDYL